LLYWDENCLASASAMMRDDRHHAFCGEFWYALVAKGEKILHYNIA